MSNPSSFVEQFRELVSVETSIKTSGKGTFALLLPGHMLCGAFTDKHPDQPTPPDAFWFYGVTATLSDKKPFYILVRYDAVLSWFDLGSIATLLPPE